MARGVKLFQSHVAWTCKACRVAFVAWAARAFRPRRDGLAIQPWAGHEIGQASLGGPEPARGAIESSLA